MHAWPVAVVVLIVLLSAGTALGQAANHAPDQPQLVSPTSGANDVTSPVVLNVFASDADANRLTVTFYGREYAKSPDFVIAVFGDTQNYYSTYGTTGIDYFKAQSQWLVTNRQTKNIAYMAHVGDGTFDNIGSQWAYASDAVAPLEDSTATGLPSGIPMDIAVGNHDELGGSTALYNTYFGIDRFSGRGYYGGHYSTTNDNHYDLFSAGGMDFIAVNLAFGVTSGALSWANQVLQQYTNRRAIVISHELISPGNPASWSGDGLTIYNAVKVNPNLFLMLCGHNGGDGKRVDVYNGNTVYTLMTDYSGDKNGGNGYIRLLTFSPATNNIHVTTYSPTAGPRTASPTWDLPYTMGRSFAVLGTSVVPAGSNATLSWGNLAAETQYEWYARVSDGIAATTGSTWSFSTVSQLSPLAPTALQAAAVPSRQINLSWTDNSANESGFEIDRSLDGISFAPISTVGANTTVFNDTGLAAGNTYYYKVRAFNAIGSSGFSNVASAHIAGTAPVAPTGLTALAPGTQIALSWTDASNNEDGFRVERSVDGVTFSTLSSVVANVTTFTDNTVQSGIRYSYRVLAFNSAGLSTYSNVASASAAQVGFAPVADVTIRPDYPSSNFGTETELKVDGDPLKEVLLKFAVSGVLGRTVSKASLNLWVSTDGSVFGGSFYRVADNSWTENTVTWNNAPAADATPIASLGSVKTDFSYSVDLTSVITGDGTYSLLLKSTNPDGVYYSSKEGSHSPQLIVAVQDNTTQQPPAAPSGLTATAAGSSEIDLSWTDNSANESAFEIDRSLDGINFAAVASVASNTNAYTDAGLKAATLYYYRVRAFNSGGNSGFSSTASAQTVGIKPASPTSLTTAAAGADQINLGWADNSSNEDGFSIERSDDGTNFVQIATVASDSVSYNDAGLSPATLYYYRVSAFNSQGSSTYSNVANASTGQRVPAAPSGLATQASSSQIDLTWTDNSSNEDGFKIERSSDGVAFEQTGTVAANVISYSDATVAAGTGYYYRLRAYNTAGDSAFSNIASATTTQVAPAAPTSLTATPSGSTQVNLSWSESSSPVDGFTLERSSDDVNFTSLVTLSGTSKNYSDTGLTAGTTYYYRVRAFNSAGTSQYSNTAKATTSQVAPAAPSDLTATTAGATQIGLTWSDSANNEDGFTIERSGDGASFTALASVAANVNSYSDGALTSATKYYYRVRAFNQAGDSGYSNIAGASTGQVAPAAPASLTAISVSSTQVNLAWTDNASNEDAFKIERSADNVTYTQIATTGVNATTYNDTGLMVGATYYYRVRATNSGGDSGYSNVAGATTGQINPAAPTNLTATVSDNTITLTWIDNSSNEDGFSIERSLDGSTFNALATAIANATSYSDSTAAPATTYHYRVQAFSSSGKSAYSNVASAAVSQITLQAVADVTIRPDYPSSNFGSESDLKVDGDPLKEVLLKFTVTGVSGKTVTKALLSMFVSTDGSVFGGSFYRVFNNSWTESGVTWNNAPIAEANPIASFGKVRTGAWFSVDVTPAITGDGTYSFLLKSTNPDAAYYSSKENSNPPKLVLTVN
jgi:titin